MSEQEIIDSALKLFKAQKYAEAIPYYQKAIEIRKKYQQWSGLAMELLELGTCYYYNQQIQECFQTKIDSAMVFMQIYDDDRQDKYLERIMENFRFVGSVAHRVGAPNILMQFYNKLIEDFNKLNDDYGKLLTYRNAIPSFYRFQMRNEFLDTSQKAIDMGEKLANNPQMELKALKNLEGAYNMRGLWFKKRGDMDTAHALYKKCLLTIQKAWKLMNNEPDRELVEAYVYGELNFGALMYDVGKTKEGVEHLEKAYDIAKKNSFWAPLQDILSQLGHHVSELGDYEKMAEYFEEAFDITTKRKDEVNYGIAYNNLARAYEEHHRDFRKAKENYEKGLEWARKFNDLHGVGKILANIAKIKEKQGLFDDAINIYLEAIETTQPQGIKKEFKAGSINCPNPECNHQIPVDVVGGQAMMMQTCSECNSRMSIHVNAEDNTFSAQIIGTDEFEKGELKVRKKEMGIQGYEFATSALKYVENISNAYNKKYLYVSHDINDLMGSIDYALQSIALRQSLGNNLGNNYYNILIKIINRAIELVQPLRSVDPGKARYYMKEIRGIAQGESATASKIALGGFEVSCPSCRFTNTVEVDDNLAAMVNCEDCGSQFSVVYDEDSKEFFTNLVKEQFKAITTCGRCGSEIAKGSRFCGTCGFNFLKKKCPRCFSENNKDNLECEFCGTSFSVKVKETKTCTNCDTKNDNDALYCVECGQDLSLIHCNSCGNDNSSSSRYCKNCGEELVRWYTFLTQSYGTGTKYIGGIGRDDITVHANIEDGFDGKTNIEQNWNIQTKLSGEQSMETAEDGSTYSALRGITHSAWGGAYDIFQSAGGVVSIQQSERPWPKSMSIKEFMETTEYKAICRKCMIKYDRKVNFCVTCGEPVNDKLKQCSKCFQVNNEDALFCTRCSHYLDESEKLLCPNCQTENPHLTKFCSNCKIDLETDIKFCPKCGTVNYVEAEECQSCNTNLESNPYKMSRIEAKMTLEEYNSLPNRNFNTTCPHCRSPQSIKFMDDKDIAMSKCTECNAILNAGFVKDEEIMYTSSMEGGNVWRKVSICPRCWWSAEQGSKFCFNCGLDFIKIKICRRCFSANYLDSDLCHVCGADFSISLQGTKKCSNCGVENISIARICAKCEQNLVKTHCTHCDTDNEHYWTSCLNCGYEIGKWVKLNSEIKRDYEMDWGSRAVTFKEEPKKVEIKAKPIVEKPPAVQVKFNGMYKSQDPQYTEYLRFYSNGNIIYFGSKDDIKDLFENRKHGNNNVQSGNGFEIEGNSITFSTKHPTTNAVLDFKGTIEGDKLSLNFVKRGTDENFKDDFVFVKVTEVTDEIELSEAEQKHLDWLISVGHKIDKFQAKGLYDLRDAAGGTINSFSSSGGNITIIKINRKELKKLPDTFKYLNKAHTLDFEGSGLSSLPPFLSDFNRLNTLTLAGNEFETFPSVLDVLKEKGVNIDVYDDLKALTVSKSQPPIEITSSDVEGKELEIGEKQSQREVQEGESGAVIKCHGLYKSQDPQYVEFLKFYPDKTVLYFADKGQNLKEIFNKWNKDSKVEKGEAFSIHGDTLKFTVFHTSKGYTDFEGQIDGDALKLKFHNRKHNQDFEDTFVFQKVLDVPYLIKSDGSAEIIDEAEQKKIQFQITRTEEESFQHYSDLGLGEDIARAIAKIETKVGDLPRVDHIDGNSYGVQILDRKIIGLGLADRRMGEFIEEIGHLKDLLYLSVKGNGISFWVDTIATLSELRMLDLSDNLMAKMPPFLKNLKNLENLHLNDCDLDEIPDWISDFKELRLLSVKDNNINTLPKSMKKLKNLSVIELQDNPISSVPSYLKKLNKQASINF